MISNLSTSIVQDLTNYISPISLYCHFMKELFSSPYWTSLWVNLCFQSVFCIFRRFLMCNLSMFLKVASGCNKSLNSSCLSKKARVALHFEIRLERLDSPLAQCFRTLLRSLNLSLITWALLLLLEGIDQVFEIWLIQFSWLNQQFSNLKVLALGILVPIWILQGMWYEVVLARGKKRVWV